MDVSPIQLGAEIRRLRYQLGITQRQVAQRLGGHFAERDIHRIETGQAGRLAPHHLQALLRVFGKDLQCFLSHRTPGASEISAGILAGGGMAQTVPWSERSTLPDLAQARSRLQLAMQSSQAACRRSKALLRASDELAGQWRAPSNTNDPSAGSLTSAP
jgi:transcriptional regulator with XRE-family HTH domain